MPDRRLAGGVAGDRGAALLVVPLVLCFLRDRPRDLGRSPYGADPDDPAARASRRVGGAGPPGRRRAARRGAHRPFWLLAGGFAICGATTDGLIGTHFIPAAHDHGMPATTAAGLLAVVGVFDIVGTIASGWLTDRVDPRMLLGVYYVLRGASLAVPAAAVRADRGAAACSSFIVFYGLDWVATVPPTLALCREHVRRRAAPVVFGWVFASHQLGAAFAAFGAGLIRDVTGAYDVAWLSAGALCVVAAGLSLAVRRTTRVTETV